MEHTDVILPGSTVGILGGGELACLLAKAARTMDYKVVALDPDAQAPIRNLCDRFIVASFHDQSATAHLAELSDVVTVSVEHLSSSVLNRFEHMALLRPSASCFAIMRDRMVERTVLNEHGFPTAPWRLIASPKDVYLGELRRPCILKVASKGHHGRKHILVHTDEELVEAVRALEIEKRTGLLEEYVDVDIKISVVVTRAPDGRSQISPAMFHTCKSDTSPNVPSPDEDRLHGEAAQSTALDIAETLKLVGAMTVEFFVSGERFLVDTLTPHIRETDASPLHGEEMRHQAEQTIRAICNR